MRSKYLAALIVLFLGGSALRAESQEVQQLAITPVLAVTNGSGQTIPLLSIEAYRAEFLYLRRVAHEIDLSGPARKMTGSQRDIQETQWPFMQFCYFGFACVNLAKCDAKLREDALQETRWLIEALQKPRLTGFIADHFGPPFGKGFSMPSVFVHGLLLNLLVRYREATGDTRYDVLSREVAVALSRAFAGSAQGLLPTYPQMYWPSDDLPALSALVRYDRIHGTALSSVKDRYLQSITRDYLDEKGLMASYVDPAAHRMVQGARGVGITYALHFLGDIDPDFAQKQYKLAKLEFFRSVMGFAAIREFPEGVAAAPDVDSGAIVFGLGTAASGFGIAAAAVMDDEITTEQLLRSSVVLGMPILTDGELRYAAMPPVGQSVILFGKTELLKHQLEKIQKLAR